jgi:hypothetical protein
MIVSGLPGFSASARDAALMVSAGICPAVNEAEYVWNLVSDEIRWDGNAGNVLKITDLSRIATGRAFALLHSSDVLQVEIGSTSSDEPVNADQGVPYHTKYWLSPNTGGTGRLWIEDIGRWQRDHSGAPILAAGVVRVLAEERT